MTTRPARTGAYGALEQVTGDGSPGRLSAVPRDQPTGLLHPARPRGMHGYAVGR